MDASAERSDSHGLPQWAADRRDRLVPSCHVGRVVYVRGPCRIVSKGLRFQFVDGFTLTWIALPTTASAADEEWSSTELPETCTKRFALRAASFGSFRRSAKGKSMRGRGSSMPQDPMRGRPPPTPRQPSKRAAECTLAVGRSSDHAASPRRSGARHGSQLPAEGSASSSSSRCSTSGMFSSPRRATLQPSVARPCERAPNSTCHSSFEPQPSRLRRRRGRRFREWAGAGSTSACWISVGARTGGCYARLRIQSGHRQKSRAAT